MVTGAALALGSVTLGVADTELVTEQVTEQELRRISQRLRCPVCQGENLYDSRSDLAQEMRTIIREQLAAGRTDTEIVDYFVARYGDFVRLEPRWDGTQLLIWLVPVGMVLVGFWWVTRLVRRRAAASPPPPAGDPEVALAQLDEPDR